VTDSQASVRTRHVFFMGGFDPKGASSFYQQHRAELAHYCALSGVPHTLGPRQRVDAFSQTWTTHAQHTPVPVDTVFEYLVWDDVVRSLWARSPMALARQGLRSLWDFSIGGSIRRLHALAPATAYAALFPYALVLLAVVGVIGSSALVYALLKMFSHSNGVVALGTALVAALATAVAWRGLKSVTTTWFLRVVDFANTLANGKSSALEGRLDAWCTRLCTVLADSPADEVLVVGYSAGSSLAVSLLARVVAQAPTHHSARLNLLTIGNCIPVAAALPVGKQVRADLASLSSSDIAWVDYTSPIDWGSYPLCNPIAIFTPQAPNSGALRHFISPQFHLLFSPAAYQALKKNKYRVHQQYLQCPERIGAYDYFAMLYGAHNLRNRFAST
jgi:hypothetical protein